MYNFVVKVKYFNLLKAVSVNNVSSFGISSAVVFFEDRLETGHEHKSSVSKPDDVVGEEISNSESNVLQSCEHLAFLDQSPEEVTWQLQCLILHHEDDLILRQSHVVDTTFGHVIIVVVFLPGWQNVKRSLQVPVAATQMQYIHISNTKNNRRVRGSGVLFVCII